MSPHIPDHLDDVVLPGVQQRAIAVVEGAGARFVDMRSLPMTAAMFRNEDHMNEEGSVRFTAALAKALGGTDAALGEATPPPPLSARLVPADPVPAPPDLAAVGGTGRWIPPGSTLRIEVGEAWGADRGPFGIEASLEAPHDDDPPPVVVEHARLRLPLEARWAAEGWRRWSGSMVAAPPPGPFEITLTTDPHGPWVRLTALALGPPSIPAIGDRRASWWGSLPG